MIKFFDCGGYDNDLWGNSYTHIHSRTMEKLASTYVPQDLITIIEKIQPRPEGRYILLNALGAYEYWGCFAPGTDILMESGQNKSIDQIRPGEYVITHTGKAKKVVNVQITQNKFDRIRLNVEGIDQIIETTPEHPFLGCNEVTLCAVDKYKRCLPDKQGISHACSKNSAIKLGCAKIELKYLTKWIKAEDLKEGNWLVYNFPEERKKSVLSLSKARLIGLWLAEGHFSKYGKTASAFNNIGNAVSLEFTFGLHEETTLVQEVLDLAEFLGWKAKYYKKESRSCITVFVRCGQKFCKWLKKQFGEYSYGKKLPYWILTEPKEIRLALLGGFIDGDGCYNIRGYHNDCIFRIASKNLAEGLQRLIWTCGSPARLISGDWGSRNTEKSYYSKRTHYQVSFSLSKLAGLALHSARYKFKELKQNSKIRSFVYKNKLYLRINKIDKSKSDSLVYNLEVENDNSYIAGGVTVHNCNSNGDAFPEWSLKGDAPPADVVTLINTRVKEKIPNFIIPPVKSYGGPTFLTHAKCYQNHINKDPTISCGDIIAQSYNDKMHRVELIIFIYKDRAPDIVRMIDSNIDIPFSMGSKLFWDVCSICSNISRNRSEYCQHLKNELRQYYPDGRKVFSYNHFPVFFDISKVNIPADKTAWSLKKVASNEKIGTIEKRIVPEPETKNLGSTPIDPKLLSFIANSLETGRIADKDEILDPQFEALKRQYGIEDILRSMLCLGMLPNSAELNSLTGGDSSKIPEKLDFVNPNRKLIMILGTRLPEKSYLDPHFSKRAQVKRNFLKLAENNVDRKFGKLLETLDYTKLTNMIDNNPIIKMALHPNSLESSLFKISEDTGNQWLPFIVVCSLFTRSINS